MGVPSFKKAPLLQNIAKVLNQFNDYRLIIMEANTIRVEITTPVRQWSFEQVISCTAPGVLGSFQVLHNHAPLLSQLDVGEIKLKTAEGEQIFASSGGFLEVLNNEVSLLLETCEPAEEIDVQRAEQAAERARRRLKEREANVDTARANAALARAMNRIRVAKKTFASTG